jgi:hypothetical protein
VTGQPPGTYREALPDCSVDTTQEFEQRILAFKQYESQCGKLPDKEFGVADWFEALQIKNQLS